MPVLAGRIEALQSTVLSTGQVMLGPWVSLMVMICTQVLLLLQLSVAVQVRAMLVQPPPAPGVITSLEVILLIPLQSSVAVAIPVSAGRIEALQSTVLSVGQVMLGPWVSVTVMVCTQVLLLFQLSVAVQVRAML